MSVQIVNDQVINSIVNFIDYETTLQNTEFRRICEPIKIYAQTMTAYKTKEFNSPDKWMQVLAKHLYNLNVLSWCIRYDEPTTEEKYTYKTPKPCTTMQVFKSIQCLLYQCGECIQILKLIEDLQDYLCNHLLMKTMEYQKADWNQRG